MTKEMKRQSSGLGTSAESMMLSKELALTLQDQIEELVRQSNTEGLTINEAEGLIADHKITSISPRFRELEKQRRVVRILDGIGHPTKRFPEGSPRYVTRYDSET